MRGIVLVLWGVVISLPVAWASDVAPVTQSAAPRSTPSTSTANGTTSTTPSLALSSRLHIQPADSQSLASKGVKITPQSASGQGAGAKKTVLSGKNGQGKYRVKRISDLGKESASGGSVNGSTTSDLPHYQIQRVTGPDAASGTAGQQKTSGSIGLPSRVSGDRTNTTTANTAPTSTATTATTATTAATRMNAQPFHGGRPVGTSDSTTAQ